MAIYCHLYVLVILDNVREKNSSLSQGSLPSLTFLLSSHLLCYKPIHGAVKTIGSYYGFAFCMSFNFHTNMKWVLSLTFQYTQGSRGSLRLELY